MDEVFPVLGGIVLGLAAGQLGGWIRWIVLAALTPLIAYTASLISGELVVDWRFVLVDIAEVGIAAVIAAMGSAALRGRMRARAVRGR